MKRKPMTKTESARLGRQKSPWGRGPHCQTTRAAMSHARYVAKGKK